ncbi:gliding motility-associated-like protein [Chitinophaga dinghuensis]|uniref:Gliding motility-associated-like protein n=1 Tax=Chitinophaga dinghuensis TaxID=1539050 RepID=A0A327VYC4_9BACT|nr:MBG domain-containing protein [Chitinophaga dinghuensis]RAJ76762.1 gliding motility-associated-like protein [Chitinophaga dinghuensis]
MKRFLLFFAIVLLTNHSSLYAYGPDGNGVLYVKKGSSGSGSGWNDALGELAYALQTAAVTGSGVKEIWVAGGTYYPLFSADNSSDPRTFTFSLVKDVAIYGGFAGTETSLAGRDLSIVANTTTLSGNIGNITTDADNAYHVMLGVNLNGNTTLDGLTITEGNANQTTSIIVDGFYVNSSYGGGIEIQNNTHLICRNVSITNNKSSQYGGGIMSIYDSDLYTEDCIISNNTANLGGGMCIYLSNSTNKNLIVSRNKSNSSGAGIYANAVVSLNITGGSISENTSNVNGGGIYAINSNTTASNLKIQGNMVGGLGAGAYFLLGKQQFTNILVTGNFATGSAAAYYFLTGNYQLINNTIVANGQNGGFTIGNSNGTIGAIYNTVMWGNDYGFQTGTGLSLDIKHSLIQGRPADPANNNLDGATFPQFISVPSTSLAPTTAGNFQVNNASPLINKGNNTFFPNLNGSSIDLAGNSRVSGFANGGTIDIGAYEVPLQSQTITASNITKTYGDAAFESGATASSGLPLTYSSADNTIAEGFLDATDNKWKIKIKKAGTVQITISQAGNGTYIGTSSTITLTINQAPLTVVADDANKTYDGAVYSGGYSVTYSGFATGENETALTGTLTFGGNAILAVNVGTYNIVPSGLSSDNYTISYSNGTLTIKKKVLSITAKDVTTPYNGSAYSGGGGVDYSGFVGGEDESLLTGTLTYAGTSQGAVNAGGYPIAPGGLAASNYTIQYVTGTLSITKAALTITAKNASKTYDGSPYSNFDVTYSTFAGSDDPTALTGTLTFGGTAPGAVNAGLYTIIPAGLSSNNYTIAYDPGELTINKAILTVTAADASKTYDKTSYSGGYTVGYGSFVNGEDESVISGTPTFSGAAIAAMNAGTYPIIPAGLSADNYTMDYKNGTLTIQKAALKITANDDVKTYDGIPYNGGNGITYSPFVAGEDESVLSGTLSYTGSAQLAVTAGNGYNITPAGLTSNNYDIAFANGNLTIHKAGLTITANDASKTYDGIAYTGGNDVTYAGFVNHEDKTQLGGTLSFTGTAQGAIHAGSYVITPGNLTATNYDIDYKNGTLNINKAPLIITAINATKTYNGLAYTGGNNVTYTGLVNGESAAVLSGILSYGGSSQGAINAGTGYTITPSGLNSNDYTISYQNGILTISPAPLTIEADNAHKCEGLANPALTLNYTGFVNGETALVLTPGANISTSAGQTSAAGAYPIQVSGAGSSNYQITYKNGTLTVYPSPVATISASATTLCGPDASSLLIASGNYHMEWTLDNKVIPGINGTNLQADEPGVYTAIATDLNGCIAPVSNSITLSRLLAPKPDFIYNMSCLEKPVFYTNRSDISQSGNVSYTWDAGTGMQSNGTDASFSYPQTGIYDVSLTIIPETCPELATTITKQVDIKPTVPNERLPKVTTPIGYPTPLKARRIAGVRYNWSPSSNLDNWTSQQPVVTPERSLEYLIKMETAAGCVTVDTLTVVAIPYTAILVGNAFTPNGDGKNDILHVNLRGMQQLKYFRIYSRSGQLLFETNNERVGWDGRFKGLIQPLATYIWIAEAVSREGKTIQQSGTVTLVR